MTSLRAKKILGGIAIAAYAVSLCMLAIPFATQRGIFVSPDEHAVWTFAEQIAKTGVAQTVETRNEALRQLLFPRSAVPMGSVIVPAGFLGMPYLAGALYVISPYLAALAGPMFGMLGLCALYGVARKAGASREYALLTTAALALHPAWWYYSARSLMPNVPFVALLLCGAWLALRTKGVKKGAARAALAAGAGASIALALFLRVSEWIWIGAAIVALVWNMPLRLYKKEILSACGGFVLVAGGALGLHALVYGSPFTTGYTVYAPAWEVGGAVVGASVAWYEKVFALVFPFGVHEKATLRNAWNYLVVVFPWMTSVAIIGAALVLAHARTALRAMHPSERKNAIAAGALGVLALAYLTVLYGSWTFYDNPDPTVVSLGNSHVRYWLAYAVISAPLIAAALLAARDRVRTWAQSERTTVLANIIPLAALVLMGALSANEVFFADDGIVHTRAALATFVEKRDRILEETPNDAIIIVDRADKYLWPDRAVVVPLRSEKTYANLPALIDTAPLYYFGITLPEEDLTYLQNVTLKDTGITFTPVITLSEETLYVIHR